MKVKDNLHEKNAQDAIKCSLNQNATYSENLNANSSIIQKENNEEEEKKIKWSQKCHHRKQHIPG